MILHTHNNTHALHYTLITLHTYHKTLITLNYYYIIYLLQYTHYITHSKPYKLVTMHFTLHTSHYSSLYLLVTMLTSFNTHSLQYYNTHSFQGQNTLSPELYGTFLWNYFEFGQVVQEEMLLKYEPRHEISNNMICVTSKGSDQPAQSDQSLF